VEPVEPPPPKPEQEPAVSVVDSSEFPVPKQPPVPPQPVKPAAGPAEPAAEKPLGTETAAADPRATEARDAPAAKPGTDGPVPISIEESIEAKLLSKARKEVSQSRAVSGELKVAPAPGKQSSPKPADDGQRSVEVHGAEGEGTKWNVGSETLRHSLAEDIRFELGFDGDAPPPADTGLKGEQLELSSPDDITGVHPREAFSDLERAFFDEQLEEEEDTFEDLFAEVPEPPTVWEWFRTRGKGAEKTPSAGGPSVAKKPTPRPRPPAGKRAASKKTGTAKQAGTGGRKKSPTSKSPSSSRSRSSGKKRPRKPRKK
jgi:hypothetical protein